MGGRTVAFLVPAVLLMEAQRFPVCEALFCPASHLHWVLLFSPITLMRTWMSREAQSPIAAFPHSHLGL